MEPAVDTTMPVTFESEVCFKFERDFYTKCHIQLIIEKNCGDDNICVPDLQITAKPFVII